MANSIYPALRAQIRAIYTLVSWHPCPARDTLGHILSRAPCPAPRSGCDGRGLASRAGASPGASPALCVLLAGHAHVGGPPAGGEVGCGWPTLFIGGLLHQYCLSRAGAGRWD